MSTKNQPQPKIPPTCQYQGSEHCIMKSVRHFDIRGLDIFLKKLPPANLFTKLEHITCYCYGNDDLLKILPQLGPKCFHFYFRCAPLTVTALDRWLGLNSALSSVTHLGLGVIDVNKSNDGALFRLICENFSNLTFLSLEFTISPKPTFTSSTCTELAKLPNLFKLRLSNIRFDLDSLESCDTLTPQPSLRVLHLINFFITSSVDPFDVGPLSDQKCSTFCRFFARSMPNLKEIGIYAPESLFPCYNSSGKYGKLRQIRNHFTKNPRFNYRMLRDTECEEAIYKIRHRSATE